MILLADNEGSDQTVWIPRLIWGFYCSHMPRNMFSHGAAHDIHREKGFFTIYRWHMHTQSGQGFCPLTELLDSIEYIENRKDPYVPSWRKGPFHS